MVDLPSKREQDSVAALVHQTGPSKSTVSWLKGCTLDVFLSPSRIIRVGETHDGEKQDDLIARLHGVDGSYEIESRDDRIVRVNRRPITNHLLKHGDMIEFGDAGPLSRFRLYQRNRPVRKSPADILSDEIAYLRTSRRSPLSRSMIALGALFRRMASETTLLFRLTVMIAISGLVVVTYQQNRLNILLQQRMEQGLDSVSRALTQARSEALTPDDLQVLKQEIKTRLSSNTDRLKALERRSEASARVVTKSMAAVVFLQGAYGFRETSSGQMLRHIVDDKGEPLISPLGKPLVTLGGIGPVAEKTFTGTGFIAGENRVLITNRHVALPWEDDASLEAFAEKGLKPEMTKFIYYAPRSPEAGDIELVQASDDADLAVLRIINGDVPTTFLALAAISPAPGDEVVVMGYPTGLRALLAQSGKAFIEELEEAGDTGFWSVAARLARKKLIAPLASRGIVGQATQAAIIYDADTTHGGSGGPVLDIEGAVVAVNAAILPEYGGSNIGVPISKVHDLLSLTKQNKP